MSQAREIIHVDMDAFYASVEQFDHPELKGKAVIVGGDAKSWGVVSAASYEARKFGVHSDMPTGQAMRCCPHAVLLPVRMDRYVEVSHIIRAIFEQFTPLVEPISLDEAFLDVTDSTNLFGSSEQIGRTIQKTILEQVEEVAQRLRRHKLKARTVTLKLRYGDFRTVTRSDTLREATNVTKLLWETAERIFRRWHTRSAGPLRLLGFGVSSLSSEDAGQQMLFHDPQEDKLKRLDKAVDEIRGRYGNRAVRRGG